MINLFNLFRRRKPFSLEKALAGKPVVTRDGREVTDLHKGEYYYLLVEGHVDGELRFWLADGRYSKLQRDPLDLFMK